MGDDPAQFVPRRARHTAAGSAALRVFIEFEGAAAGGVVEAELLDLSRTGLQLRLPCFLEEGRRVAVRLEDTQAQSRLEFQATVRWSRHEPDDTCVVGFALAGGIAWESLGELFLHDLLRTDPPAHADSHQE